MAHHKRGRPKNRRAGCLLCKPWKANHAKNREPRRTRLRADSDAGAQLGELLVAVRAPWGSGRPARTEHRGYRRQVARSTPGSMG